MSEDFLMRLQLQKVVAYRELCRALRRSGRENFFFALLMLVYAHFVLPQNWDIVTWIIVSVLVGSELMVGLFKWFFPSAEGFLLDGLVLLLFVAYNLGMSFLWFQLGARINPVTIFISVYLLYGAINRFKAYRQVRRLFADRPTAFFIALRDTTVWIIGPDDFGIELNRSDYGTDHEKAILHIFDRAYPAFEISTATWENYRKWRDTHKSNV